MAEDTGYAYVEEDGKIVVPTVSINEIACMVTAIAMGSQGHIVPRGNWTEEMIKGAFDGVTGGKGRIAQVVIKTLDH